MKANLLWSHIRRQQYPRIRVLDTDHPNNVGVLEVKENALNAIKVRWHPRKGVAKVGGSILCTTHILHAKFDADVKEKMYIIRF